MSKKFKILIYCFLSILLIFTITQYFVNINFQQYKIKLNDNHPYYNEILEKSYWDDIIISKEYDTKYGITTDIYNTCEIKEGYLFISGKNMSYDDANRLLRAVVNNNLDSTNENYIPSFAYQTITNYVIHPMYILLVLLIEVIVILSIYIIKKNKIQILKYSYWQSSRNEMKNVKKLCTISIIFSLQIVAGMVSLPSGFATLGIGLSYLFQAVNCFLFGPVIGIMVGGVGDLIGYAIDPSPYGFFFPYTINAILACLTYGLCFYKTKVTFFKVLISRIIINLFINVVLGSIWWGMVIGLTKEQSLSYALYISLPKNLLYLIPQTLVLFLVIKGCADIFYRNNYIEEYQKEVSII